jgi:DNA topoisomerase-3
LQIDAAKLFGLSAKQVLDVCQELYEKHKLITYPRSDCRYLPKGHHAQAADVCRAISTNAPDLAQAAAQGDLNRRSSAWNDAKVEAHHGIIPTQRQLKSGGLLPVQLKIYALIARNYLYQFFGPYCFELTRVEVEIQKGAFKTSSKTQKDLGWRRVELKRGSVDAGREQDDQQDKETEQMLPVLSVGQILHCLDGIIDDKQTSPPKYFTDATLLAAMTGIGRFVKDQALKSILKETDGLGTEATRAGIIELLFKRCFLKREGKSIKATEAGHGLIAALPESVTLADMTAQWEADLNGISQKRLNYAAFMEPMVERLTQLIAFAKQTQVSQLAGIQTTPSSKRRFSRKRTKAPNQTRTNQVRVKRASRSE